MSELTNVIYGLSCVCHPERGIRYVGQTEKTASERLYRHLYMAQNYTRYPGAADLPVYRWIRKHGPDNIETRVLEQCSSPDELDDAEVRWIAEHDTFEHGLNCSLGGASLRGYKHSEETRKKLRGRKYTEETRQKMSDSAKLRGISDAAIIAARSRVGQLNHNSLLTDEQVFEIKYLLWSGQPGAEIARQFDIKPSVVSHISTDVTGRHVPWPIGPRQQARTHELQHQQALGRKHTEESKQKMSQRVVESWTLERRAAWSERFSQDIPSKRPEVAAKIARAHASLTDDQVRQVRYLRELGRTYEKIAEEVGSNMSVVYRICKRRAYTWVE